MLKDININVNALEYMLFFWQSVMERQKVNEYYLTEVADLPEMAPLYDGEFNPESVRKVLSAISNREVLNTNVLKERQFWSNNMWVMEDPELLNAMISPIKTLNLDSIKESLNKQKDIPYETVNVIFVPALKDFTFQEKDKLYINFFKVMVDVFSGTGAVTIDGKSLEDYVSEKILEMK